MISVALAAAGERRIYEAFVPRTGGWFTHTEMEIEREGCKVTMELRPGDCLLYAGSGLLSRVIRIKTWSDYSHCETYIGHGRTIAARAEGVREYPLNEKGLKRVLRPNEPFDLTEGLRWFMVPYDPTTKTGINGQRYDTLGLLRFFTIGKQSTEKQFCSELLTRFYRMCGMKPFAERFDADLVSPGMFDVSPHFDVVWDEEGEMRG